jgi:MoxR-like ATPase
MSPEESSQHFQATFEKIRAEIGKFIVGQADIVENVLIAIISGGHVLLEGVPGLGKTALVNTIAKALHLKFQRIQFTPDLLPADVVGTQILVDKGGQKVFDFQPGPVFCNVLLADEINRATPKTQSALLETMQEKTVTVANTTHRLPSPFFVLATQNPIENEGTYPLPEAQLDRFFFKLFVEVPSHDDFVEILNRTTGNKPPEISAVATGEDILQMGRTLREVPVAKEIQDYLVRVVRNTHPSEPASPQAVKNYIRHGSSPRGAQTVLTAARARALLKGRFHVSKEDINAVAVPALRHRMILSFEGEAEGIRTEMIINEIVEKMSFAGYSVA